MLKSFSLAILDGFDTASSLDVLVDGDIATLVYWDVRNGLRRERGVTLEAARAAYRAFRAAGGVEVEADDEPYFDEEAAYEAAVDARMSRAYAGDPSNY